MEAARVRRPRSLEALLNPPHNELALYTLDKEVGLEVVTRALALVAAVRRLKDEIEGAYSLLQRILSP